MLAGYSCPTITCIIGSGHHTPGAHARVSVVAGVAHVGRIRDPIDVYPPFLVLVQFDDVVLLASPHCCGVFHPVWCICRCSDLAAVLLHHPHSVCDWCKGGVASAGKFWPESFSLVFHLVDHVPACNCMHLSCSKHE
jgi:hypothetical protein